MSRGPGEIDVAPFREAVLTEIAAGRETWASLCRRLGWIEPSHRSDYEKVETSRLQRRLGVRPNTRGANGRGPYQKIAAEITYETALAIVKALDRDAVEFGL